MNMNNDVVKSSSINWMIEMNWPKRITTLIKCQLITVCIIYLAHPNKSMIIQLTKSINTIIDIYVLLIQMLFMFCFNFQLWEVDPAQHRPGTVEHTVGWPLVSAIFLLFIIMPSISDIFRCVGYVSI